ncbi:MAG TPA: metallophosphoesterase [Candidatus Binataceae bacterium]|nr:metallophosphoesterase [Candidatus Binataceae bacterium]
MSSLADHFAGMLKDASFSRNTLDFNIRRDLFTLIHAVASDPVAKRVDILATDSASDISAKLKALRDSGSDLRTLDQLAQALGVSEMPGFGQYEEGDPRWIECLINYYKYRNRRAPFPEPFAPYLGISELIAQPQIKIGIVGDWGTGATIAQNVIQAMASHAPDYTIHLGDVYYSGADDEELDKFLPNWPFNNGRSYALNSNHEMYSGGNGYFGKLLADPKFAAQHNLGYFALTNDQWLIIGLDSAYFTHSFLYQQGAIAEADFSNPEASGMVQINWLKQLLQDHKGKRIILMTHHDGFSVDPAHGNVTISPLYTQITSLMQDVRDWWWYWGHVHTVTAYLSVHFGSISTMTPRCVGHGAIPYMPFPPNYGRLGSGDVKIDWTETDLARDPQIPLRAPNGFLLLTLTGADLREEFYDERNHQRWSNY